MTTLEQTYEKQSARRDELTENLEFIRASILEIKGKLGRALADGDEPEARDLQERLASAQARETSLGVALTTMAEDIQPT